MTNPGKKFNTTNANVTKTDKKYLNTTLETIHDDDELLLPEDAELSDATCDHLTMKEAMKTPYQNKKTVPRLAVLAGLVITATALLALILSLNKKSGRLRSSSDESAQAGVPTSPPVLSPSTTPSMFPSLAPSDLPTTAPTALPNAEATVLPSSYPSGIPSEAPSQSPSMTPSDLPSWLPTHAPTFTVLNTTFYATGDAPYSDDQAIALRQQIVDLPGDAEFLIHVGDIRNAEDGGDCKRGEYERTAEILKLSHAPVFVLIGDNDWNDCPHPKSGLKYWNENFLQFDNHWGHPFDIKRQKGRAENFAFVHKRSLFIGLNLVGGEVHSTSEWKKRLRDQAEWTIGLIEDYVKDSSPAVGRVVIFGHADPSSKHRMFFHELVGFINVELQNQIPILYLNGDKHYWLHENHFMGQPSLLRIMVAGHASEAPVKIVVKNDGRRPTLPESAFKYTRFYQ